MSESFQCRSCDGSKGKLILDLGIQPLANNLPRPEDLAMICGGNTCLDGPLTPTLSPAGGARVYAKPEPRFPLRVFVCPECWLLQITDLVPPVELFSEYLYFSSFSETMLRHARKAAQRYIHDFALSPQSQVIEIASNDGYLLKNFRDAGVPCLGIEPAANIAKVARDQGIATRVEFFTTELAGQLVREGRQADLILGNNVFAHVPAINDFVAGLRTLLKRAGRIVLEFPYAVDMLEKTEFDTIYHEHVFYFTLTALVPLFERHELEIVDIEQLTIHGGSLRIYAQHAPKRRSPSPCTSPPGGTRVHEGRARVTALLKEEHDNGIDSSACYEGFAAQVEGIRQELRRLVLDLKNQGKTVAAYGASAKGSTLLNYCGLDYRQIEFVADRSTYKQGRFTPGTHIPIVAPDELVKRMPDYTLLLTWNFAEEILEQQQAYRRTGGKFILPIPQVRVA